MKGTMTSNNNPVHNVTPSNHCPSHCVPKVIYYLPKNDESDSFPSDDVIRKHYVSKVEKVLQLNLEDTSIGLGTDGPISENDIAVPTYTLPTESKLDHGRDCS